jgi:predicted CXXCH cytochrome family protein
MSSTSIETERPLRFRSPVVAGAMFCFVISLFLIPAAKSQSPLEILFPKTRDLKVRSAHTTITGFFDDEQVTEIHLLRPWTVDKKIKARSKTHKENFPNEIRSLFSEGAIVTGVVFRSYLQRNGRKDSLVYHFSIKDRMGLARFWKSTAFEEMFGRIHKKKISHIDVTLVGWTVHTRAVSTTEYTDRFDTKFVFSEELHPGMNLLYLWTSNTQGDFVLQDSIRCFFSMEVDTEDVPETFQARAFHLPENEEDCNGCHDLELPATVIAEESSIEEYCITCHQPMQTLSSVHSPVEEWECLSCHDATAEKRFALYADKDYGSALCLECHGDIEDLLDASENMHVPAEDDCRTCHDPHGSARQFLITRRVKELCSSCHEDAANTPHPLANHPSEAAVNPLMPSRSFTCASCHNPHASSNPKLLVTKRKGLCQHCHKK